MTPAVEERFWAKVDRRGPDECWEWRAGKNRTGYGLFGVDKGSKLSHRIALRFSGVDVPDGMFVCHRCDNPPCCNPAHLFLGTQFDNMRDCSAKGRVFAQAHPERLSRGDAHYSRLHPERLARGDKNGYRLHQERYPRGEGAYNAKLTEAAVRDIRKRHAGGGVSKSALAREYGVAHPVIRNVISRKTWAHVVDIEES